MGLSRRENALRNLKKINKKWKKLKKEVDLNKCLCLKNNKICLDTKKWLKLSNYIERIKHVPAIIDILDVKYGSELIKITYDYYNPHKHKKEVFTRVIPIKLEFNEEMMYFLGLWCGDRFRVGISNNCYELLRFTSNFLINRFKQPKSFVLGEILSSEPLSDSEWKKHIKILKNIGASKIRCRIDKRKFVKRKVVSYAILLSNNFILWHILRSIEKNLETLFKLVNINQRCAFYAGFFDAEGHVNKYHQRFEWHQYIKNHENLVKTFIKYLKKDGFHPTYKNSKWIFIPPNYLKRKDDFRLFKKLVLFYLKNPDKIAESRDLIKGILLKRQYVILTYWLYKNPNKTSKEIAQAFNQSVTHTREKLRAMIKEKIIIRKKHKMLINKKGKEWIKQNKELLYYILNQVRDFNSWGNHMYVKSTPAMKELLQKPLCSLVF